MKLAHALRITSGDSIAFVGGGGKSSAMFRLADELAQQNLRVLTTTSTRIFAAQIKQAPTHVTFDPDQQSLADILPQLNHAFDQHRYVLLIGQADKDSGKAFGISPETIDALASTGNFDVIINEADGSRMRPFKAPAPHEPVIPASTTIVVPVVGIDAVGQLLNDDTTHRAERVSQLSNTPLNQPITPQTIVAVLCHPQGGLKNIPTGARVVPLLNKVARDDELSTARDIGDKLLRCPQIDSVAIGAVQAAETPIIELRSRTAAVVLAAGGSGRFGSPKQLARWQSQTFIERVVDVALDSQAEPVVVVLGAEVEQSRALLKDRAVEVVVNPNWAEGQSSSLKAGLANLPQNASSAIFLLVDQPLITPEIIDSLIARYRQTLAPLVWPEFEGKRGNPVLFDRRLFAELNQISGDTGGRPVLMAHKNQAERVAIAHRAILQDFDRPEEVKKLKGAARPDR